MEHFHAGYGKKMILEQLQFQAYAGEMVALLGANGAGKTTFFRSLMQLPSSTNWLHPYFGSRNPFAEGQKMGTITDGICAAKSGERAISNFGV
ncbi:ATP-binding cassette domain-containing protein [Paenibacillus periandrae]|uniref:ATP-binding cassette domain-containing protein n=1 Tax=Paenibacillus periandrae TaxID=1761741 RepID=UPI001F08C8B5|nr:ATP-binding cassette domain-containing protein [Paenibacillus periandrae]